MCEIKEVAVQLKTNTSVQGAELTETDLMMDQVVTDVDDAGMIIEEAYTL